jgi:ABC-2 type transport system ATP-binding protein
VTDPVRAESLTKRYGETLAVDGVDLVVRSGEVYGFLGPNGAGKTRRSGWCSACTDRARAA